MPVIRISKEDYQRIEQMKGYIPFTKFISLLLDKAEQPQTKKKAKSKQDPRTKDIVQIYFEEFEKQNGIRPDYGGAEAMHVKQLIKKLDEVNKSDEPIQDLFRILMQNLPEFYKSKSIRAINGNFKSIIAEIKNSAKASGIKNAGIYDYRT